MIKINGVTLPAPKPYQVDYQDINKAERNAKGDMIIERIATKRKIQLSWGILTQDEASTILGAVSGTFFTVAYIDPITKGEKTGTFYAGDRNAPMITFTNGVAQYDNIKFNLIER